MISIKDEFLNLRTRRDVARVLGMTYKGLLYVTYHLSEDKKYTKFSIPKKRGGERIISKPVPPLMSVQRKLLLVLSSIYEPKPSVHGATANRSIVTNAKRHVKSKFIINLDLLDFFPSIHFGRIRGLFLAYPFNFCSDVSSILAQLVCTSDGLPQGAPTSPLLANMVAFRLDKDLQLFAKKYSLHYTRYFDDITLSTKQNTLPVNVAYIDKDNNLSILGEEVRNIIERNGFIINESKTRIYDRNQRQEVTGITVNRFTNLKRNYVRQIRAMLYAWDKFGYEQAQTEYISRYRESEESSPEFRRVVKGKLDYLKMVRGERSELYEKLYYKYNILDKRDFEGGSLFKRPSHSMEQFRDAILILESEWEDASGYECYQGTAFSLDGYGFVSCDHVLPPIGARVLRVKAYRCNDVSKEFDVEIKFRDSHRDLSLLEIKGILVHKPLLAAERLTFLRHHAPVSVAGFPHYKYGDDLYFSTGAVVQRTTISGVPHIVTSANIIKGNSGGPVLNEWSEVVGVAVRGIDDKAIKDGVYTHKFVPITEMFKSIEERK